MGLKSLKRLLKMFARKTALCPVIRKDSKSCIKTFASNPSEYEKLTGTKFPCQDWNGAPIEFVITPKKIYLESDSRKLFFKKQSRGFDYVVQVARKKNYEDFDIFIQPYVQEILEFIKNYTWTDVTAKNNQTLKILVVCSDGKILSPYIVRTVVHESPELLNYEISYSQKKV